MSAKVSQGGMEIPIEMVQLKNKMMTTINFQGQTIKQGVYDGEVLWSTNFMTQKAEKSDEETTKMVVNELKQFPDPFLNYKEKGFTAELMGTETVDGTETFKVKLTTTPNIIEGKEVPSIAYYFFDTENFVPIQVHEEIMDGPGKGMITEIKMSDYQRGSKVETRVVRRCCRPIGTVPHLKLHCVSLISQRMLIGAEELRIWTEMAC